MKFNKYLTLILFFVIICSNLSTCSSNSDINPVDFISKPDEISYTDLGIPLANRYTADNSGRNIWDMTVFDGKLYIGSGDYDKNAGPVEAWCYDIISREWSNSGTLPDEQINRFIIIDSELIVPGTDPQADWTYGNYYVLRNGKWKINRTIPGGIHNFDMVYYHDKLFAGLDVVPGKYPVVCSNDNGNTFTEVEFWKEDEKLNTSDNLMIRTYELIILNDTLYAVYAYDKSDSSNIIYDLYRYENERFIYDNRWSYKIIRLRYWYMDIGDKAVFKDKLFFTTGYLFMTENMKNLTYVNLPDTDTVWDIFKTDNALFVLGSKKLTDGSFLISVYKNSTGEEDAFTKLFSFNYELPARCFTYSDRVFYFGMGALNSDNEKMGTVLSIQINS